MAYHSPLLLIGATTYRQLQLLMSFHEWGQGRTQFTLQSQDTVMNLLYSLEQAMP